MGDQVELSVEKERLRLAYDNFRLAFITIPVAVLVVVLVGWTDSAHPMRLIFWGALILFASVLPKYYYYRGFKKPGESGPDYGLWGKKYCVAIVIGGVAWGATPLILFPGNSAELRSFIALIAAGMTAGASFAYAPMLRPARIFATLALIPIVIAYLIIGGLVWYSAAFMMALFYLMLMLSMKNSSRLIEKSIRLGLENTGLVTSLAAARDSAEADADLLIEEVKERVAVEGRLIRAQRIANFGNWNWDIKSGRFSMSKESCHLFGLTHAEGQMTYEDMVRAAPPHETEGVRKALKETILEFKPLNIEHTVVRADGSVISVHQLAEVIHDEKGEPVTIEGTIQDITQRKAKEEELRAAKQKAEEATKVKDKFISIVAHDIRGPFGTMLALLKYISKDADKPLHRNHKTVMERVLATGNGMMEMFENLLEIGRLQTGSLEINMRFIDIHAAVASAIEKQEAVSESKGVKVINDVPLKTRIFADATLSATVFQNLISNAVKFSKKGQEIRLFLPGGRPGVIAVKDCGTGVNPKILPDMFKPDVKTTAVGTGGERGTGFGLPFCQEIMKAHGGKISVESAIGEGSVFYVEFPPVRPRILIVDDDDDLRAVLAVYLKALDVSVMEARDGESALRLIAESAPHLIIADMNMPGMGGFELLENLKKDKSGCSIPFIMITGGDTSGIGERVFQLGGSDFIKKPFSRNEFIPRVNRFIG